MLETPGSTMRVELVTITPERAAEWLQKNTRNRPLTPNRINYFEKELRTGRAATTHQGIAFDSEGRLQDGQHRLTAIVNTGIAWAMWVTWDAPIENFHLVDVGFKRSLSDVLDIRGIPNARFMASVGKVAWAWERGRTSFTATDVKDEDIAGLIARYPGFEDMPKLNEGKELNMTPTTLSFILWISDDESFTDDVMSPIIDPATAGGRFATQHRKREAQKMAKNIKWTMGTFIKARNDWAAGVLPTQNYALKDRDAFPVPMWDPRIPFARTEDIDDPDES